MKVGDKVKVKDYIKIEPEYSRYINKIGTIVEIYKGYTVVKMDDASLENVIGPPEWFEISGSVITSGVKNDNSKPDLALIPKSAKEGIARAFMDGEKKYGRYNYLKGMDWSRLLSAADRHLSAFNDGEDCAEDSTLNHLYHAGANICMLIEYYEKGLGNDNRFKSDS